MPLFAKGFIPQVIGKSWKPQFKILSKIWKNILMMLSPLFTISL